MKNDIERIIEDDVIPIVMDLVHEYGKFESIPGNIFNKSVAKAIEQYIKDNYIPKESNLIDGEDTETIKQYVIKARIENSKYLLSVVWSKLKETDCLEDYFFSAKEILDIFEERIAELKKGVR